EGLAVTVGVRIGYTHGPRWKRRSRMHRLAVPLLVVVAAGYASPEASSPPPAGSAPAARQEKAQAQGAQGDLASLAQRYLSGLFRAKPHLADYMGDHRFANQYWELSPNNVR